MEKLDFVELKITARFDYLLAIRALFSNVLEAWAIAKKDIQDIEQALVEVCKNICNHAYTNHVGEMIISCFNYMDRLDIIIFHYGQGVEMKDISLEVFFPEDRSNQESERNQVISLLYQLMDKIEVKNETGIMLKLTKFKYKE